MSIVRAQFIRHPKPASRTGHLSLYFLVITLLTLSAPSPVTAQSVTCNGKVATIVGTNGGTLTGTNGDDVIVGLGAFAYTVHAGNGNDTICTSSGSDSISAGNGNDWVDAGEGNDTVIGDNGNDLLLGGAGTDQLDGGNGNDRLEGGEGNDMLIGQNGDDTLFGGPGNDSLTADNGMTFSMGAQGPIVSAAEPGMTPVARVRPLAVVKPYRPMAHRVPTPALTKHARWVARSISTAPAQATLTAIASPSNGRSPANRPAARRLSREQRRPYPLSCLMLRAPTRFNSPSPMGISPARSILSLSRRPTRLPWPKRDQTKAVRWAPSFISMVVSLLMSMATRSPTSGVS